MNQGCDLDLVDPVRRSVHTPVVASSGAGAPEHFVDVFERTAMEAALATGVFHREEVEVGEVKNLCRSRGVLVRRVVARFSVLQDCCCIKCGISRWIP
ncbi:hypothetical protein BS47DRAFT_1407097 [Hydnum rufescens UP504]|uniref:Uncharacterized protein n=1 Tax=Hydnum rufescens UP504 TaxID=1448309 RepID=A0A9P6AAS1_9AGAM|nr:hypothetical protein BS47DRAFT_1407097 [Hydnum rufescens UP504]